MKRAGLPAVIAILFGCAAMLGAQSSSGTRTGSDQNHPTTGIGAQNDTTTPPQARTTRTSRSQTARNEHPQIVATGCLTSNDQSGAIGTAGTGARNPTTSSGTQSRSTRPQTGTAATAYMLTNATSSSTGASTSTGAASSVGAGANTSTPSVTTASGSSSYMLQ